MLRWLFNKHKLRLHEDSFARTRSGMLHGLHQNLARCLARHDSILLITHFTQPFTQLQNMLESSQTDYDIVTRRMGVNQLCETLRNRPGSVLLSLAEMLNPDETLASTCTATGRICVMVAERHPHGWYDSQLHLMCQKIPGEVELGYFMSLEDATVRLFVNENVIRILDMFGMSKGDIVASNLLSRQLSRAINQNGARFHTNHPADSASQWLQLNGQSISAKQA